MRTKSIFCVALTSATILFTSFCCGGSKSIVSSNRQEFYVPEEQGINLLQITQEGSEKIQPPAEWDKISGEILYSWMSPRISVSNDGKSIAFIANQNRNYNIFVKRLTALNSTIQRTFRNDVIDVCYSPDSKNIAFSEMNSDGWCYIYVTHAEKGNVVQQISPSNVFDHEPHYSLDGKRIFFTRGGGAGSTVWSYDLTTSQFSNHCYGSNPYPVSGQEILCSRMNTNGLSEIWLVNYVQGTETRLLGDNNRSYINASVSPDGKWLLFVCLTKGRRLRSNYDIYYTRLDGTGGETQITYHPGNDCSPIWSHDGRYIYFLSQRGTRGRAYNVWRMDFKAQETLINDYVPSTPRQQEETKPEEQKPSSTGIRLPKRSN